MLTTFTHAAPERVHNRYYRIFLVDTDALVLRNLSLIIQGINRNYITETFSSYEDAVTGIGHSRPDLIILDLDTGSSVSTHLIRECRKRMPRVQILVHTTYDNPMLVFQAFTAGANGYLLKGSSAFDIVHGVEDILHGGAPMSSAISRMVVDSFKINANSPLSKRETEVLTLLAKGKSYTEIAEQLFIAGETAKTHLRNIYKKLSVNKRSDAIRRAMHDSYI